MKLKELVNELTLEYILTKDKSVIKKVEEEYAKLPAGNEGMEKILHKYGVIAFYDLFEGALKKKNRKYYEKLNLEIKQKGGDAEIDIDYLEKICLP